jgi:hypothetical protein
VSETGEATSYEDATERAIAGAVEAALVDHANRSLFLNLRGIAQAGATLDMAESSRHSILMQIARTLALRNDPPAVLGEDLSWLTERATGGTVPCPPYETRTSGEPFDAPVTPKREPFMPMGEWSRSDLVHCLQADQRRSAPLSSNRYRGVGPGPTTDRCLTSLPQPDPFVDRHTAREHVQSVQSS